MISQEYPHTYYEVEKNTYNIAQEMRQFVSDGFFDRYTEEKKMLNDTYIKNWYKVS